MSPTFRCRLTPNVLYAGSWQEPEREENHVPPTATHSGICSTCKYAPTCCFQKDSRRPVLQCEEFEPDEPARRERPAQHASSPRSSEVGRGPRRKTLGTLKGLCVDCDNLDTCMYPKPESGVWHCEEYH